MSDVSKEVSKKVAQQVSEKVKSAITAKLVELGVYVDVELVEYIMVLVANKKKREEMEDDLGLFLEENTVTFTKWLRNVLEKLDEASILPGSEVSLNDPEKHKLIEGKKMENKKGESKKLEVKKNKKAEIVANYIPLPPSPEPLVEPVEIKTRQPIKFESEIPVKSEKKDKKKKKDKEKKKKDKKEKKKKKDKEKDRDRVKSRVKSSNRSKSRHSEYQTREGSMPSSPKEDILNSLKMDNLSPPNIFITVKQDCSKLVNTVKPPSPVEEPESKESSYPGSPKLRDDTELIEEGEEFDDVADIRPSEDFSLDTSRIFDNENEDRDGLSTKKDVELKKKVVKKIKRMESENINKKSSQSIKASEHISSRISKISSLISKQSPHESECELSHDENEDAVVTVTRVGVDSEEDTELSESDTEPSSRKITSPIKPKLSILDRLGPAPRDNGQRILNLREESSFPSMQKGVSVSRTILRASGQDKDRPKRLEGFESTIK